MAVLTLPQRQRLIGLIGGTIGAVVLRIVLIAVIMQILLIPFLQALGGLVLLWIAIKLVRQDTGEATGHKVREVATLWEAIGIIIVARPDHESRQCFGGSWDRSRGPYSRAFRHCAFHSNRNLRK